MERAQTSIRKPFDYGVGALSVLVISIGAAAIVYSLILQFDWIKIPAWLLGPLGVYTLAYSAIAGKNSTYYLVWGAILFSLALTFGLYNIINPLVILGILAILISIIGLVAYQRSKK